MDMFPGDKGLINGSCNRSCCLAPGATWFNHSARKYYCGRCASLLNSVNKDWAFPEYGHHLCTPVMLEAPVTTVGR
jgi:hypothetical protein